jgi:hypothetical protein
MNKESSRIQVAYCPHCGNYAPQSLLKVHAVQTSFPWRISYDRDMPDMPISADLFQ